MQSRSQMGLRKHEHSHQSVHTDISEQTSMAAAYANFKPMLPMFTSYTA